MTQQSVAVSPAQLQRLVDQSSMFNVFMGPDPKEPSTPIDGENGVIGMNLNVTFQPMDIDLHPPSFEAGVKALNRVGPAVGSCKIRMRVIPWSLRARPDREPPAASLDPNRSQRFSIQEGTFRLGDAGFRSFGTGRTLPSEAGGRPQLILAATGNVSEGWGKFSGHHGNYTLCGALDLEQGFTGHVVFRFVDPEGHLHDDARLSGFEPVPDPHPGVSYLTWVTQKGEGSGQVNSFSFAPDGQIRAINIPVDMWRIRVGFTTRDGFLSRRRIDREQRLGLEVGWGIETQPRCPDTGTALEPFQFQGSSDYTFYDAEGRIVGSVAANFLEGRNFKVDLEGAPEAPGLRFSYYGPIVGGKGCFSGVEGFLYGAGGGVIAGTDIERHVITNHYVCRINDPDGRFRAVGAPGQKRSTER